MCLGLGNGCVSKEEKMSLLKRKTNNDRINEMSIEDKANFLEGINCSSCAIICSQRPDECDYANLPHGCRVEYCLKNIKQWLESEAK